MPTRRILIDAGHGGSYSVGGSSPNRATGPNGLHEKDVALDLARRVSRLVNGGSIVSLTRDDDVNLSLAERAAMARRMGADVFLSLHFNRSEDPSRNVAEAFVARGAGETSRQFASALVERVARNGGMANGGVRRADLGVLLPNRHSSSTLACLLELGHLTNPRQARSLEDEAYRERLAAAIAEAMAEQPLAADRPRTSALGGGGSEFSLSASVGTDGVNKADDVLALKQRFHDLGFDWVTVGNSSADGSLIKTINLFQSIVRDRQRVTGDGKISVPGSTYDWLRAVNAPRWQLMPEGSQAEGFINFERQDDKDNHDYGTDCIAGVISAAGAAYRDDYLATHEDAAVIGVNDVSVPKGDDTPDHTGHETGLACDLRLPRTDGESGGIKWTNTAKYDRDAARAQIKALRAQALVSRVFFNDTDLIAEGICEKVSGHDDHIHFEIKLPARIDATSQALEGLFTETLDIGDGSPFVKMALEHTTQALKSLSGSLSNKSNPAFQSREAIKRETGITVDENPYFGVTPNELEAVIRAGFTSHQMPEVLLAIWAKEGSTRSVTSPRAVPAATTAANAKTIFRNEVYYVDLGADHFMITTRKKGEDNKVDFSDGAAAGHEKHFKAKVKELVKEKLLDQDISSEINKELKVTKRADGAFLVEPTTRFYALSLLLVDALFTRFQNKSFKQLSSISPELNYLHWNMGSITFQTFLESAERHRNEPEHKVDGRPITIDQWALHTKPKKTEWRQARANAIRFMHYVRSYRDIFEPSINLIKPGIYDLRDAARDKYSRTAGRDAGSGTVLGYGVAGAKITDPFYRDRAEKGSAGGRKAHYGIDVSISNKSGGDENDSRRGLPVYAVVQPTLDIAALNAVRAAKRNADKTYSKQKGLGIRGSGVATLREAKVNVQPWDSTSDGAYGGVLGLACYYDYTKTDGTTGTFTIYVEYLHLITSKYLPKKGDGKLVTAAQWSATGKGIGFGPKMVNGATLSASELTSGEPLLVGYLGATQFPHVHIQAAFSTGKKNYLRAPRLDPTAVLRDSVSTSMSLAMGRQSVDEHYVVSLIPQPDKLSCWAGSMAMVVSYYRQQSISAEDVVNEVGRSLRTSYDWSMLEDVRKHYGFKNVPLPSNMSFAPTPQQWHDWLVAHGPLWVTTHGAPSHAVVVHGIHGDLTVDGTTVDVMDPWDYTKHYDKDPIDFHPPNNALELPKMPIRKLQDDFAAMGLSNYGNWRVLYISRTPETAAKSFGNGGGTTFSDPWDRAINHFGGIIFDPKAYDHTVDGFQEYLDATGVKHFSATEMTRPNHPDIAKKHGFKNFLPKYEWWPRGAALGLLADKLRNLVGESVRMRNWWRPKGYNEDVDGEEGSDHLTAHGIDLDYKSAASRRKAEKWLRKLEKDEPWLELSLGLGNLTTHVGILSPQGHRDWFYKSYTQSLGRGLGRPTAQGPVGAGRDETNLNALKSHGGKGPNLIARWNVPAGQRSKLDVLVHLHGFIGAGKTLDLRRKEEYSGADFSAPTGSAAGRTEPTLALIPRGFKTGARSKDGSTDVYDFPALTNSADGLTKMVDEALDWFATQHLSQNAGSLSERRLILTAHSGGGARLLKLLAHHDPDEVYLFDALYQSPTEAVSWAKKHIAKDAAALAGLGESDWASYMSTKGGALRALYTSGKSTTPRNRELQQGIDSALKPVSNAKIRDFLAGYYRVERSAVGHNLVPRTYGWKLLANSAADLTP